jgi:hypothetical protein
MRPQDWKIILLWETKFSIPSGPMSLLMGVLFVMIFLATSLEMNLKSSSLTSHQFQSNRARFQMSSQGLEISTNFEVLKFSNLSM